jgi:glycosyltransferase involved in cell wall biosynthesis
MLNLAPIVATETEGAKELLNDGESAALVPVGDPVAMASAVVDLLNDPAKRARFAEAARSTAAEKYSLKSMIDQTEELYESVQSG